MTQAIAHTDPAPQGRVLLVDDEPFIVGAFERMLTALGYSVTGVPHGAAALDEVRRSRYDVVVSDILMPEMDGMALLRAIRETDLDLPVVLLTGNPTLDTAMKAVEYGALRYLTKPVDPEELGAVVKRAIQLRRLADVRRDAVEPLGQEGRRTGDRAGLEAAFERAIKGLWMAFQPIVRFSRGGVWGFEALARTTEPLFPNPGALFEAAERLELLPYVGRAIRRRVAAAIPKAPTTASILVNVHPHDLLDDDLLDPAAPLARHAKRVILEITERAPLDEIDDLPKRVRRLREIGFRLAIDDVGAGYAGLGSFARLEPDVAKLDMLFVRGIAADNTKQQLVKSLASLCHDLYVDVIAEGVETAEERDVLVSMGCDLLQGWLYGKPDRGFRTPTIC